MMVVVLPAGQPAGPLTVGLWGGLHSEWFSTGLIDAAGSRVLVTCCGALALEHDRKAGFSYFDHCGGSSDGFGLNAEGLLGAHRRNGGWLSDWTLGLVLGVDVVHRASDGEGGGGRRFRLPLGVLAGNRRQGVADGSRLGQRIDGSGGIVRLVSGRHLNHLGDGRGDLMTIA